MRNIIASFMIVTLCSVITETYAGKGKKQQWRNNAATNIQKAQDDIHFEDKYANRYSPKQNPKKSAPQVHAPRNDAFRPLAVSTNPADIANVLANFINTGTINTFN